jgi:hypothetical protein
MATDAGLEVNRRRCGEADRSQFEPIDQVGVATLQRTLARRKWGFSVVMVFFEADLPPQGRIAIHRPGQPSRMGAMRRKRPFGGGPPLHSQLTLDRSATLHRRRDSTTCVDANRHRIAPTNSSSRRLISLVRLLHLESRFLRSIETRLIRCSRRRLRRYGAVAAFRCRMARASSRSMILVISTWCSAHLSVISCSRLRVTIGFLCYSSRIPQRPALATDKRGESPRSTR